MMRLRPTPASELPAIGEAAAEVVACDLSHSKGRWAVRMFCGKPALRQLLQRRARFITVIVGAEGRRCLVEYSESEFVDLGAHLIDYAKFASGPIVLTHFGVSQEMRERMLNCAKHRDLETTEPAGRA